MKKTLGIILLSLCVLVVKAQRVDSRLTNLMKENARIVNQPRHVDGKFKKKVEVLDTALIRSRIGVRFKANGTVDRVSVIATLADGMEVPSDKLQKAGINVKLHMGKVVVLSVPADSFDTLVGMEEFMRLDADKVNRLHNNITRTSTSAAYVTGEAEGYQSLSDENAFTGKGVVVGVVDSGIDFNHPAFRDPQTGATRIKEAIYFDENDVIKVVTDPTEIDKLTTGNTEETHGTHVAATAAGSSGDGIGKYGIAPEADLVLCDLGMLLDDSKIIACYDKIFSYAANANKPVVINMSLGSNLGFHDGSDPILQAVSGLTGRGKIIVVSAGNEGIDKISVHKTLDNSAVVKTIVDTYDSSGYTSGINAFIYADGTQPFSVELKTVDVTTGDVYTLTEKPIYQYEDGTTEDGTTAITPSYTVEQDETNQHYNTVIEIPAFKYNDDNHRLGIFVTGQEGQTITILEEKVAWGVTALCGPETYPATDGFTEGNADVSINTMACNDSLISVGAYVDRTTFVSRFDNLHYGSGDNSTVGRIATFSSYGIDDNGTRRPDILAPGLWLNSAVSSYYKNGEYLNEDGSIAIGVTDYSDGIQIGDYTRTVPIVYGAMSGTSMACPVVTGIVALWLQKYPQLSPSEVRKTLSLTALNDQYTRLADYIPSGNIIQAGLGKIDALRGIQCINKENTVSFVPYDETFTMSSNGIATFSSQHYLDFSDPLGPKAYIAESLSDNTLTFNRVLESVPTNTGLLITADAGEYRIPIVPTATDPDSNYLVGTANGSVTLDTDGMAYVLSKQNDAVGFYQNAAGLEVPQGKAYLDLSSATSSPAKIFGISLEDVGENTPDTEDVIMIDNPLIGKFIFNKATGIAESLTPNTISDIYDLTGRKVNSPQKGIYIMGGKKVLFQ